MQSFRFKCPGSFHADSTQHLAIKHDFRVLFFDSNPDEADTRRRARVASGSGIARQPSPDDAGAADPYPNAAQPQRFLACFRELPIESW